MIAAVKGLAEYRRGNDQDAVDWCLKYLARKQTNWLRTTEAYLVMAMAQARLGELGKATEALESGRQILSNNNKQPKAGEFYDFWNRIICHTLLAEAETVVQRAER